MEGTENSELIFFVNGRKIIEKNADPECTLLFYLRNKLRLTGTKLGCSEGGCGACTVMVSKVDSHTKKIRHMSLNACLAPLCSVHGMAVTTVEGIGSSKTKLHPVQERIARSFGSQCGFCTPGFVMSMYTLLRSSGSPPSSQQLDDAFQGNLCRCTGYRPILDGFKGLCADRPCKAGSGGCCRDARPAGQAVEAAPVLCAEADFTPYDASQEPIFPAELQLSRALDETALSFRGERSVWLRPVTLEQLLQAKARHPDARIVCGNTEVGVEIKFKNALYPVIIAPTQVPNLISIRRSDNGLELGAAVTLNETRCALQEEVDKQPEYKTRLFVAIIEMLRWFAGDQIRNVASLAGNIMTASPISDLNPLFLAAKCKLRVASVDGEREVFMDDKFFCGYRKTSLKPKEVLVSISLPYTDEKECVFGYKQSPRREDDIAIVNAGMYVRVVDCKVQQMRLSFGGMAPTTVLAQDTATALIGREWDENVVTEASDLLFKELRLSPGVPGGMARYRQALTASFFFKFFLQSCQQLNVKELDSRQQSATCLREHVPARSAQLWRENIEVPAPAGRSVQHVAAEVQATGEARYIDDMPPFQEELYAALVLSERAHARIVSVDTSAALCMPGVVRYVDHHDVTGDNVILDECIFAENEVTCQGAVIGLVLADTQLHAQRAARAVKVTYEELQPVIISIEDAIKHDSYFGEPRTLCLGNPEEALEASSFRAEGQVRVGGQEHFYMETQACICVPKGEKGEMEVFASTQNPTHCQKDIALALGVPASHINVRTKRLGGGFGGKETRFNVITRPVAVASHITGRPVRCMLDRDEDMISTGTRHPFLANYKVGFEKDGTIKAFIVDLYSNCGNSLDLSGAVMERALFHIDNAYGFPNVRATGRICKTNIPSNTAFRGFGGPQGMFVTETVVTRVSEELGIPSTEVRNRNLYKDDQMTHFGQLLGECPLRRCWDQCLDTGDFSSRLEQVVQYNKEHRWTKRGMSVIPTKFGISFTFFPLNQAGALVNIYTDGSVLLSHGGTEMGQGLHTKMIQVASSVLQIPAERVHIAETNTACVPNTSATAASASSDLNGMAVKLACETLLERLARFREAAPDAGWEHWVNSAYMERVSLSATGFYKTPDINFDWKKGKGRPFNYFTYGVCCTEVQIDCLTGDHQVLRSDIVFDLGKSLNPAVDIGQIEGAFAQGYGLFVLEQQKVTPRGLLLSRGPGMYKLPGFGDVPRVFNVSLLTGSHNPRAIYSSKAVGEPPLFLASSAFFAIREAIRAARQESENDSKSFRLDSPATAERIRLACTDQFTKKLPEPEPGSFTPWYVDL